MFPQCLFILPSRKKQGPDEKETVYRDLSSWVFPETCGFYWKHLGYNKGMRFNLIMTRNRQTDNTGEHSEVVIFIIDKQNNGSQ